MERSLVIIKPDAIERDLVGKIIKRYETRGLKIKKIKILKASEDLIKKQYPEDEEYLISLGKKSEKAGEMVKDYKKQGLFIVESMRSYMTSGLVIAMILEGEDAIQKVRDITGYTDPKQAEKGTIRGDLGQDSILEANKRKEAVRNLVHASGSKEEAEKEIILWFGKEAY